MIASDSLPGDNAARHISSSSCGPSGQAAASSDACSSKQSGCIEKSVPGILATARTGYEIPWHSGQGNAEALGCWMRKANDCGIYSMKRFAKTLRRDWAAVRNALQETFSNGPVEGHINRLKTIKRQMYGRAGFQLLRARLLPPSFPVSIRFHLS